MRRRGAREINLPAYWKGKINHMPVEDQYQIASELCHADISALPPEKIAAAIRARRTIHNAIPGSATIIDMVYDRAAELLDIMADMADQNVKRNGGEK